MKIRYLCVAMAVFFPSFSRAERGSVDLAGKSFDDIKASAREALQVGQILHEAGASAQKEFADGSSFGDFIWATVSTSNKVNSMLYGVFAGGVAAKGVGMVTANPLTATSAALYVQSATSSQYLEESRYAEAQIREFLKNPSWEALFIPPKNRPGFYDGMVAGPDSAKAAKEKRPDGLDEIMLKIARRNLDAKLRQFPAAAKATPGFADAVATMRKLAEAAAPKMAQTLANRLATGDQSAIDFFQSCEAYSAGKIGYEVWVKAQDKYNASKASPEPKGK